MASESLYYQKSALASQTVLQYSFVDLYYMIYVKFTACTVGLPHIEDLIQALCLLYVRVCFKVCIHNALQCKHTAKQNLT